MRTRLFLKIYLAFLGIVVACVVAAGLVSQFLSDRGPVPDHVHEVAEVFVEDLPAEPDQLQQVLVRRSERLGLIFALYDGEGALLASSGDLPRPRKEGDHLLHGPGGPCLAVALRDGRWLVSAAPKSHGHVSRHLLALLALAGLAALLTYPLARGITRRIETLRQGVEELGGGDLAARVPVQGRDEVAALARSFNRSADRIAALVDSQRRMLASASHELRSPLARLRLSVELLHEAQDPAQRRDHRDEAVRDVEELDQLVEDLLLAGRLEVRSEVAAQPVELLALAAEEAARIGAEAGGAQVDVLGDEALLRIMLRNLLENAQRHGGAPVALEVAAREGGARLVVSDGGPGVPEAERERIFEPFYRPPGRPEGEGASGAGLGLALVRRVAELHGGQVRCLGAAFEVELPLTG